MCTALLWKLFKKTKIKHYLYLPPSVQLHLTTAPHLVLHHWWWSPSQGMMWSSCHHVLLVGSPLLCWMLHFQVGLTCCLAASAAMVCTVLLTLNAWSAGKNFGFRNRGSRAAASRVMFAESGLNSVKSFYLSVACSVA